MGRQLFLLLGLLFIMTKSKHLIKWVYRDESKHLIKWVYHDEIKTPH